MYTEWKSKVDFAVVYIREAHPDDGWQVPQNKKDGIVINDPKTEAERRKVAQDFAQQFSIKLPIYIDGMDDAANKAFAAWPDRIYVIDLDGKVAYKSGPGPAGFKPDEMLPTLETLTKS
ncbi:MAG: hypothetical protein KF784_13185 [Fimbriimonadaceae bacterium]|nr:hypothetical protein [Fimbriimonadaceae bacterium]